MASLQQRSIFRHTAGKDTFATLFKG
uniref:Uncharacterized protein n=1 Tax=Anguilla anguilla TaxID=7936 RepID=A0A0E9W967_ANGAN